MPPDPDAALERARRECEKLGRLLAAAVGHTDRDILIHRHEEVIARLAALAELKGRVEQAEKSVEMAMAAADRVTYRRLCDERDRLLREAGESEVKAGG